MMYVELARHAVRHPPRQLTTDPTSLAGDDTSANVDVYTTVSLTTTIQLTPVTAVPDPQEVAPTSSTPTLSLTSATTLSLTPAPAYASSSGSPTQEPSNAAPISASKSNTLPSGLIAGIAVSAAVVAALLVCLLRRRVIGKRNKKTVAWGGKLLPIFKQQTHIEKSAVGYPFAFRHETANAFSPVLPRPTPSYNNPVSVTPSPSSSATAGHSGSSSGSSAAAVCCTFIPSMPDELSITNGEMVRIINEFDDGWALCLNIAGEQGMVPLECLQKGAVGALLDSPVVTEWRNAQRTSSIDSLGAKKY